MFIRFMICHVFSGFVYCVVLLLRKLFQNRLSAKTKYHLWFFFLLSLLIFLIPSSCLSLFPTYDDSSLMSSQSSVSYFFSATIHPLYDFTENVVRLDFSLISLVFKIWVIGMIILGILYIYSFYHSFQNEVKYQSFFVDIKTIKKELHVKQDIKIMQKEGHFSPYTYGFIKPKIVLPSLLFHQLSLSEKTIILKHEIIHIQHHDGLMNIIMVIIQIIYWMNPFVWLAIPYIKEDQELYCDSELMIGMSHHQRYEYGQTLLHFSFLSSHHTLSNTLSSKKKFVKKRIHYIVKGQIHHNHWIKLFVMGSLISLIMIQCPIVFAFDSQDIELFDNHSQETLYGYEGTFVLYDQQNEHYTIYNQELAQTRFSPNSTYKIMSAIIALENQTITIDHNEMAWDHTQYPIAQWNQNQTLQTAMTYSTNWYFQNLDHLTSKKTIQNYLERFHYGNMKINSIQDYWLESSLKISPLEQVQFLRNLNQEQSHIQKENVQYIKSTLLLQQQGQTSLYGKTGSGKINGHEVNGWFIGFIEKNTHTYYFATYIKGEDDVNGMKAAEITLSLLDELGIIKKIKT